MSPVKDLPPIRSKFSKPSDIVELMIRGLRHHGHRDGFRIDMGSFGEPIEEEGGYRICVGCAATCALQEVTGHDLEVEDYDRAALHMTPVIGHVGSDDLHPHIFGYDAEDVIAFEIMINRLRRGEILAAFQYLDIEPPFAYSTDLAYLYLCDDDWEEVLSDWDDFLIKLRAEGY